MRNDVTGMTRRQFTALVATPLILGIARSAAAQRGPAWEELGKKEIEGKVDHDKIKCHGKEEYRALQFRVKGAADEVERGARTARRYKDLERVHAGLVVPVLHLDADELHSAP